MKRINPGDVSLPLLKGKLEDFWFRVHIEQDNTGLMIYEGMNPIRLHMDKENCIIYINISTECKKGVSIDALENFFKYNKLM